MQLHAHQSDKVLDLLISFRVYDPDGDQEEPLPERHEAAAGEARHGGPAATASAARVLYSSPAARREEIEAMAAAAAPGGLAAHPRRAAGIAPLDPLRAAVGGQGGAGGGGDAGEGRPDDAGAIAAPAAGGWGLTGGRESGGVDGSDGGGGGHAAGRGGAGEGGGGVGMGQRYFGLMSRDEWISASSSRIEKLNSRAPWKNSWTEEVPVNDKDDPYLTEDGAHLVFAVPRAPVDGSPCLVSDVICRLPSSRIRRGGSV